MLREEAVKFFMAFVNADCDKIAVENPVGYMNTHYYGLKGLNHFWLHLICQNPNQFTYVKKV